MPQGQLWSVNAQGGYLANAKLSEKLRFSAYEMTRFRQFCDVKENSLLGVGETMNFDKVLRLGTGGGTLVETTTVPSDKYQIVKGTITITEYGKSIIAGLRNSSRKILKFLSLTNGKAKEIYGKPAYAM